VTIIGDEAYLATNNVIVGRQCREGWI